MSNDVGFYGLTLRAQSLIGEYGSQWHEDFIRPASQPCDEEFFYTVKVLAKSRISPLRWEDLETRTRTFYNLSSQPQSSTSHSVAMLYEPLTKKEVEAGARTFYDLSLQTQGLIASYVDPIYEPYAHIDRLFSQAIINIRKVKKKGATELDKLLVYKRKDDIEVVKKMSSLKVKWREVEGDMMGGIVTDAVKDCVQAPSRFAHQFCFEYLQNLLRMGYRPSKESYIEASDSIPILKELVKTENKPDVFFVRTVIYLKANWKEILEMLFNAGVNFGSFNILLIAFKDKETTLSSKFLSRDVAVALRIQAQESHRSYQSCIIAYLLEDIGRRFSADKLAKIEAAFVGVLARIWTAAECRDSLKLIREFSPGEANIMTKKCLKLILVENESLMERWEAIIASGYKPTSEEWKALLARNKPSFEMVRTFLHFLQAEPNKERLALTTMFFNALNEKEKSELEDLMETVNAIHLSLT